MMVEQLTVHDDGTDEYSSESSRCSSWPWKSSCEYGDGNKWDKSASAKECIMVSLSSSSNEWRVWTGDSCPFWEVYPGGAPLNVLSRPMESLRLVTRNNGISIGLLRAIVAMVETYFAQVARGRRTRRTRRKVPFTSLLYTEPAMSSVRRWAEEES